MNIKDEYHNFSNISIKGTITKCKNPFGNNYSYYLNIIKDQNVQMFYIDNNFVITDETPTPMTLKQFILNLNNNREIILSHEEYLMDLIS